MIRYYGIYAKEHKHSDKIFKLLNERQIKVKELLRRWHFAIKLSFGYAPLKCSCGGTFLITCVIYKASLDVYLLCLNIWRT